jgi:hypothetical protein
MGDNMTSIIYEKNGFVLEQKFRSKKFKSFIYFDNVTNKTGFSKNTNWWSFTMGVIFLLLFSLSYYRTGISIILLIYLPGSVYLLYDFIMGKTNYKTLILRNSQEIYFSENEWHYIDEILIKRNEYCRETYFKDIDSYNDQDKITTVNWLYKQEVVKKFEILKVLNISFDEDKDEFYINYNKNIK